MGWRKVIDSSQRKKAHRRRRSLCKSAVDTNTRAHRHACDSTAPWDESVRLFSAGVEGVEGAGVIQYTLHMGRWIPQRLQGTVTTDKCLSDDVHR